jgi:sugar phosphate isomerase/epimerase
MLRHFALASAVALLFAPLAGAADVTVKKGDKDVTLHVDPADVDHAALEKLGWKLASQFYTWREYSAFETIDILGAMGIRYGELYPGQRLRPGADTKVGIDLSDEDLAALKQKLADANVTPMNFGVCKLDNNEASARKTFDFAKKLGLKTLVSEPPEDAFPLLDKLTAEYGINVAIHNHPKPSHYWNPDTTVAAVKGHPNIGSCTDLGHFVRSGLSTLESVKKLKGHTISLHLKDVAPASPGVGAAYGFGDVIWGTGKVDFPAVVQELKSQKFQGVMSIEYERTTGQTLVDNVRKSVANLSTFAKSDGPTASAATDNAASPINTLTDAEKAEGWTLLFNGTDTTGWRNFKKQGVPANWQVKDGVLINTTKGGDLVSDASFGNYVLDLEFKMPPKGNSGIMYRVNESAGVLWHTGPEYQLYDNGDGPGTGPHDCAAAYDLYTPTTNAAKPAGQWNRARIVANGPHVEHWLNNTKVAEYDASSDDYKQRFQNSKFKSYPNWGSYTEKRQIGLQGDHAPNIEFRNIKLRPLPATK